MAKSNKIIIDFEEEQDKPKKESKPFFKKLSDFKEKSKIKKIPRKETIIEPENEDLENLSFKELQNEIDDKINLLKQKIEDKKIKDAEREKELKEKLEEEEKQKKQKLVKKKESSSLPNKQGQNKILSDINRESISTTPNSSDMLSLNNSGILNLELKPQSIFIPRFCPVCNSKIKKAKVFKEGNALIQIFSCKNKKCDFQKEIILNL